jgi:hypothetical protein
MKYLFYLFVFILLGIVSCSKKKLKPQAISIKDSLKIVNNRIEVPLGELLTPFAKKRLSNWREYKDVDEFITSFYNISIPEALSNARELSDLVVLMKDSIRVEELKTPSLMARINVLENETLRLADMATIPSISDKEVKDEVNSILQVFSALNSKINTFYKATELQNTLEIDTEKPIEEIKKTKNRPLKKDLKQFRNKPISKKIGNKPVIK